jgi:RecA-family ATPase
MNFHNTNHDEFCHNGRVALALAEADFFVFPCFNNVSHPNHKKPLVQWLDLSTNDPEQIKNWWLEKYRFAMPALDLSKSNLVVIDGDLHHEGQDGPAAIELLLGQKLADIGCPVVVTPSGGVHCYFVQPPLPDGGSMALGNAKGALPYGIDIRGHGGYTIAPGAATDDKRGYRRLPGTPSLIEAFHAGTIPYLPDVIIEAIQAGRQDKRVVEDIEAPQPRTFAKSGNREGAWGKAALANELRRVADAPKGARNDTLASKAFYLGTIAARGWIGSQEAIAGLTAAVQGWTDAKKTLGTLNRCFKAGLGFPHEDLPDNRDDHAIELGERVVAMLMEEEKATYTEDGDLIDAETGEIFETDQSFGDGERKEETREQSKKSKHLELETVNAASFAGQPVPQQMWLIPDLIPAGNVTILSGDGATGKSLLALQLAVAVATGGDWLGWTPPVGRVAYVSAEDEIDELHRRLDRMLPDLTRLGYLEIVPLAGKDAVLAAPVGKEGLLSPTPLYAALRRVIDRLHVDFLVLDTLADLFGGDEIRKIHARSFIAMLRRIALEDRVTILLLSHPSQNGMARGDGTSGNVAWNNSVRSRLYFERKITFDGPRASEEDRDIRILSSKKSNRAPNGGQIQVRYDRGQFVREHKADPAPDAGRAAERVFLTLLELYASQGRDVSPSPSTTYAPAVFEKHPRAEGHTKRAFQKAMDRLLDAGKIKIEITGPPSRLSKKLVIARPSENSDPEGVENEN